MLVAYLLMKRKIVKMMSGYQVLRSTLQFLGEFPGSSGRGKAGVSRISAQSLSTVGEGGIVAFLSLIMRPCGWDGQERVRQQNRAGWSSLQQSEWIPSQGGGQHRTVALLIL